MIRWSDHVTLPAVRDEVHFGRTLSCFIERAPSFYAMLSRSASLAPNSEAVRCEGRRWTYGELADEVDRLAAGFAALGIRSGQRVVMFLSNRPEFISVLFALQKLGAIAVPVGTREQRPGLAYIIEQCGAAAIVYDDALEDRIPEAADAAAFDTAAAVDSAAAVHAVAGTDTVATADVTGTHLPPLLRLAASTLDKLGRGGGNDGVLGVPMAAVHEDDCACILYTSGTTGHPKGAMLTHLNIAHSVIHYEVAFKLSYHDRAALAVPASHVTGLIALIAAMMHVGGTLVIVPEFKAASFVQLAADERISYSLMVPAMYQLCLLQPAFTQLDLSNWRIGGFGGAPMPVPTVQALAQTLPGLTLVNCYGSTETTSPATIMPLGLSAVHNDAVGIAVPCGDIQVMDDEGKPVPAGQSGELWIGGAMVVPGYWDNPQATDRGFVDGRWRSGDLGAVDAQGLVRIFDRIKDMINRGGYKIYSVEVENVLMGLPGVIETAVVGHPCPVLGERVHAYLYAPQAGLTIEQVRAHCVLRLADYKVPENVVLVDAPLPRNANGKLLKRALRDADLKRLRRLLQLAFQTQQRARHGLKQGLARD